MPVTYPADGRDTPATMRADHLFNCIALRVFRRSTKTSPLSTMKQCVVDDLRFGSHPFFAFEAQAKPWFDQGFTNLSMELEHPDISSSRVLPETPRPTRVILQAFGMSLASTYADPLSRGGKPRGRSTTRPAQEIAWL